MKNENLNDIVSGVLANLPQLQTFIINRFGLNSTWVDDANEYIKSTPIPKKLRTLLFDKLDYAHIINNPVAQGAALQLFPLVGISKFINDEYLKIALKELPFSQVPGYKENVSQILRQIGEKNISPEMQVKILQRGKPNLELFGIPDGLGWLPEYG